MYVSKGPEEKVRQKIIKKLLELGWTEEQMQWKPEWKIPNAPNDLTKRDRGQKYNFCGRSDLALFGDGSKQPHALQVLFEMKEPTIDKGKTQLMRYLQSEPTCRMGIWTNGTAVLAIYKSHTMDWVEVKDASLPSPTDELTAPPAELPTWDKLQNPTEVQLSASMSRLIDIIVIEDPISTRREDQLREILHVLLVKLDSDAYASSKKDEPLKFRVYGDTATMVEATAKKMRELYKKYYVTQKNRIFNEDDTEDIKLSNESIFKIVDTIAPWKILGQNVDLVSKAMQVLRTESVKGGEGQYHTPLQIIRRCVVAMEITSSDKVIDPACGSGGFIIETLNQIQTNEFPDEKDTWHLVKFANDKLYCVDKDALSVKMTRAMMVALRDGSTHVMKGDSVRTHRWKDECPLLEKSLGGDGEGNIGPSFSVVMTNPPFGQNLKVSETDCRLSKYSISRAAAKVKSGNKEYTSLEIGLIFIEVAHRLLVKGGRLGIILPETYFFSKSYRWLPGWLEGRLAIRGIFNIPMPAFQEFCRAKTNFYIFEKVGDSLEGEE